MCTSNIMVNKKRARIDSKYILVLMLILVGALVCGCYPEAQEVLGSGAEAEAEVQPRTSLLVYFASCDGYMVPISYPVDDPSANPVKTAIHLLLEGPQSEKLFRSIPKGTRLKDWYVSNETVFLDLTHEFYNLSNSKDVARAVKSLCLTVDSLPGVKEVQILVEGEPIEEIHGVAMNQILCHGWVNYFGNGEEGSNYIVYFAHRNASYMVPVTFVSDKDGKIARTAIEQLIAGPESDYLVSAASPGTKLLGLEVRDGIAHVDLAAGIAGFGADAEAEKRFVESLLLTLGQFSDIKGVQIMVEGKLKETLPEGTPIANPLKPLSAPNPVEAI